MLFLPAMLQLFKSVFDLFFPKTCLGCSSILSVGENTICTQCRHEIPLTQTHLVADNEIKRCFEGILPIHHASSLFYFYKNHFTQELIHNLKYRGYQEVGTLFGNWYGSELAEVSALQNVDYIIPIPLHKKRLKERGYNQVETFGLALAERLNTTYNDKLLFRKTYTSKQSKKNRIKRQKDATDWFELGNCRGFENKHFLLIDDVMTTGTTLEMAARQLLKIPNVKVSIVTLAFAKS